MGASAILNFERGRHGTLPEARKLKAWPPLFERLIYYMLLPELFARIVCEALLNISPLSITQPKFWVLYTLIFIEYSFSLFSLGRQKFKINLSNIVFLLLITMTIHGLMIATYWGNPLIKTLTDTVPVLVTAMNVALLNREGCFKNLNFDRLARNVFIYSFLMVIVGAGAVQLGRNSIVSLGGSGGEPICLTIILVNLARKKIPTVFDIAFVAFIVGPTVVNTNRTTLAAFGFAFLIFVVPHIFRSAKQVYFSILLFGALAAAFYFLVPDDSMIYRRINGLVDHLTEEKSEDGGSLYERQAEWEAIQAKLHNLGPAAELFGYGPGGIYLVQFTMVIPPNYSHAHYSWAFFRLRWGYVGFLYLGIYIVLLLINFISHLLRKDILSRTIVVLDMWCIVYLFTYVFFNFLAVGLQFADTNSDKSNETALA